MTLIPTPAPVLTTAEDVATMPWAGNHASDSLLFRACERLIQQLADSGDMAGACRALHLMGLHGMGIDGPTTEKDVQIFLEV